MLIDHAISQYVANPQYESYTCHTLNEKGLRTRTQE